MSAMQRAVSAGIILVISAGNDGDDPVNGMNADPFALVPAQTFPGQVIIAGSVGVSDGTGTNLNLLSDFSNQAGQGQNWYLTALGYRVRTIDHTGTGFLYSGTSFSAPIITGAVALMAQAFPNLTAREIVEILFRTADDLGAGGRRSGLWPGPAEHRPGVPAGRDQQPGGVRGAGDRCKRDWRPARSGRRQRQQGLDGRGHPRRIQPRLRHGPRQGASKRRCAAAARTVDCRAGAGLGRAGRSIVGRDERGRAAGICRGFSI